MSLGCFWYHGAKCTGKTYAAEQFAIERGLTFRHMNTSNPINTYEGEDVIIIDETSRIGHLPPRLCLRYETKTAPKAFPKYVIVTSKRPIQERFKSAEVQKMMMKKYKQVYFTNHIT